jgi:hypothetical protein
MLMTRSKFGHCLFASGLEARSRILAFETPVGLSCYMILGLQIVSRVHFTYNTVQYWTYITCAVHYWSDITS